MKFLKNIAPTFNYFVHSATIVLDFKTILKMAKRRRNYINGFDVTNGSHRKVVEILGKYSSIKLSNQ